jgi:protein-S-isoprenylcysteine O-methyltransferase Ste14
MATTVWLLRVIFAQWIVIFYPGVLVFWLIIHSNIQRLRPLGTRAYWIAAFAWAITAGPLLFFRRAIYAMRWDMPQPLDAVIVGTGVVAFALSVLLLQRAFQQIPVRTMIGIPEIKPWQNKQPVLHSGIYSKTRNPIYLGHWLLVFSSAALTGFAANWTLFALDCIVLPLLVRAEERELLARYGGEFAEYMRRIPRFFPQLR